MTCAELAKKVDMDAGPVAGHLSSMKGLCMVARQIRSGDSSWEWTAFANKESELTELTYIGNREHRIYLDDVDAEHAESIARVLRKVMPEMKYADAFTELVNLPVKRNQLTKINK
jgi:hypothetical protein